MADRKARVKNRSRGPGEGSIYERKDGRWVAEMDVTAPGDTKRRRVTRYGKTYDEALQKLREVQRDRDRGVPFDGERMSVGEFFTDWLQNIEQFNIRSSTYEQHALRLRCHILPGLGAKPLKELKHQHIQAFLNRKRQGGLAPGTVRNLRALISHGLEYAVKCNYVVRNEAALTEPPKEEPHEVAYLTPAETRALLEEVRGHRYEALVITLVSLGLRWGEATALRWEDVDLRAGTLSVRHSLYTVGGKVTLGQPKTKKSKRTLKLPAITLAALQEQRKQQLARRPAESPRKGRTSAKVRENAAHNWVFTSLVNTPVGDERFRKELREWTAEAGLPTIRIHDLRHTAATLMLKQGIGVKVVSEILGHSSIRTTLDLYGHVLAEQRDEAAEKMNELLTPPATGIPQAAED